MRCLQYLSVGILSLLAVTLVASPGQAATFTVTRFDDPVPSGACTVGDCSLREAIIAANASPGPDTIVLAPGTYTLTIPTDPAGPEFDAEHGDLDITDDLSIAGAGAATTLIQGGATLATAVGRVFHIGVGNSSTVQISGVTIEHGAAGPTGTQLSCGGGGIANVDGPGGSGESGTVILADSVVRNNTAHQGGGICNEYPGTIIIIRSSVSNNTALNLSQESKGGGIANMGPETLIISDSTISGNQALDGGLGGSGGGIANILGGSATITNSTISGNSATSEGGGILNATGSVTKLINVTISSNTASGGGAIQKFSNTIEAIHTVIAGNTPDNCAGGTVITSFGHNLEDADTCDFTNPNDLVNTDLTLGTLADNGGPTQTHALLAGSPAIEAGDPAGCTDQSSNPLTTDQRGVARPQGVVCDIGAFEFIPLVATFATSAGQFSNLSAVPEAILPAAGKPAGVTFPFGFFAWTVTGLIPGQTITVTMTYESNVASPAQYWKVIDGTWTNVTSLLGDDNGDNILTLTITDGGLGDADGAINGQISDPGGVGVSPATNQPVANDDAYGTNQDTPLNVPAPGVLVNDTDADGDQLTAILETNTANGNVVLRADGSFTYTPHPGFHGTDTFTYTANDGNADSNVAMVTITVAPANQAPVARNDQYRTRRNKLLVVPAPGVLANDTDPDGSSLTAQLVRGPRHGTLVLNPDGSFVYRANRRFIGRDTFTYKASDGASTSNIATVTINVTRGPDRERDDDDDDRDDHRGDDDDDRGRR